jgi:hypothetical protein
MWGCERAYARSHPHIRVSTPAILKDPHFQACEYQRSSLQQMISIGSHVYHR